MADVLVNNANNKKRRRRTFETAANKRSRAHDSNAAMDLINIQDQRSDWRGPWSIHYCICLPHHDRLCMDLWDLSWWNLTLSIVHIHKHQQRGVDTSFFDKSHHRWHLCILEWLRLAIRSQWRATYPEWSTVTNMQMMRMNTGTSTNDPQPLPSLRQ